MDNFLFIKMTVLKITPAEQNAVKLSAYNNTALSGFIM
jgi:hypothetical protein